MIHIRRTITDPFTVLVDPWIRRFFVVWLVSGIILLSIIKYRPTSWNIKLKIINQAAMRCNVIWVIKNKGLNLLHLIAGIVLLVIHKNWKRSILGVVPSIYRNTVGNLNLQIWFRYQPSYRISWCIEGTTREITKFMPLIMAVVVPSSTLGG